MQVMCKTNEYIAIPTKRKSDCIFLLGQYLNKETCKIEMDKDNIRRIICEKKYSNSSWSKCITIEAADLSYGDRYIILDLSGNLVNVVEKEQFDKDYAILMNSVDDINKIED